MCKINNREKELLTYENPEVLKESIDLAFGQYLISPYYLKRDDKDRLQMVRSWLALQDFCLALIKEAEPDEDEK